MALKVIFGNPPVSYKMYAMSDTPKLPMSRYHAAIKAGSKQNFVFTITNFNGIKLYTLWVKQVTKGKYGALGWKTFVFNKDGGISPVA